MTSGRAPTDVSDFVVKPFAWGGIELSIPRQWDTAHLGEGYALLEAHSRPVLEFKTAIIKGRFSAHRQMARLRRRVRPAPSIPVETIPLPPDWPPFPDTAEVQAFRWQSRRIGGQGVLYFCRLCRRATLLQFYDHGALQPKRVPAVLASFRDHSSSGGTRVAVYDITATLPEHFRLAEARFDAGRFKLVFSRSGETVTLWRLSPADVILGRHTGDWAGVARDNGLLPPKPPVPAGRPLQDGGMEWQWPSNRGRDRWRALFAPGAPRPRCLLRLWLRARANRLLAVRWEGNRRDPAFERICRTYGLV